MLQCGCRKLRGGRCKHTILSYASDQDWFCGHCCDNLCACACPGCFGGVPVHPYNAGKGILVVRPSGMPSGSSGRSEGWPRGAASCAQSELGLQFYPLVGNDESRCHATVPFGVRGPYTRTEGGELYDLSRCLLAPTSEAVHFPRALVERVPRSVASLPSSLWGLPETEVARVQFESLKERHGVYGGRYFIIRNADGLRCTNVEARGLGKEMRGDGRDFPEAPEDVIPKSNTLP